jgi:folate-dependent phosphoribosylglycinamide formyltransferase PurN
MKVALLTTDTKHHRYCIQRVAQGHRIAGILYEERRLTKPYPTGPFLEDEESRYEERFFDERDGGVPRTLAPVLADTIRRAHSVNDAPVARWLEAVEPDVTVTFGVGRVRPPVISIARWGTVNIHRGIVPDYRGLDSDLWAILEGRLDRIGVTVHYVDETLDTGAILAQQRLPLGSGDEVHHLRYLTTVLATDLLLDVLDRIARAQAQIAGTPQTGPGRYYSAMPLDLKHRALERFREERQMLSGV